MRTSVKSASKGKAKSSSPAGVIGKPIELSDGMWDRISRKAYELWLQRGCTEGNALRDWLDAEEIVVEEIYEARE